MLVTVVTPTLNAIDYLQECIDSVKRNVSPGIEIEHIIADGGSVDGTPELADSCGLRVLRRPGESLVARMNEASLNSAGNLIGMLGTDDVMLDGAMKWIVQAYRESGRPWVIGGIRWIDENGRSLGGYKAPPMWMTATMCASHDSGAIAQIGTYLSREFFTQLGGFDQSYSFFSDNELFVRALSKAAYARLARPVACNRRTGKNHSVVNRGKTPFEQHRVRVQFGPKSELEAQFWCYALRLWINLANPEWLMHKLAERARAQLGSPKPRYF